MKYLTSLGLITFGLVAFLGLPLVGWGLGDIQGFLSHPVRLAFAAVIVLQSVFFGYRASFLREARSRRGEETKLVHRQRMALMLIRLLALGFVILSPFSDRHKLAVMSDIAAIRYLGLILYVVAIAWTYWATTTLGKQFSFEVTIQKNHRLITTGPYRYVRHPRYLGVLLVTLGFALVFRSWIGLLILLPLISVLIWRMVDEEALLYQEFGEAWKTYRERSWRLIPFIY